MATDRELLERRLKDAPKRVKLAACFAALVGLLLAARGAVLGLSSGTYSGKSAFYGALIFVFFATNGVSLLNRSRLGYVMLAVFALLPVLGSFAGALHLLALQAAGALGASPADTTLSVIAVFQLITILFLFVNLLAPTTRSYVWRSPKES